MALPRKYSKMTSNPNGSITMEKGGKAETHKCDKEEQLERIQLLLVGNDDPKTGLAFKMAKTTQDISDIKDDISEIKLKINETINAASTVASSLEKYKIEVKSFEAGKNDIEEKLKIADDLKKKDKREAWQRTIWIIMAVLAGIGLAANLYFNIKGNEKQDVAIQKVDNLGFPMQSVTRGEDGKDTSRIFYFPNDDRKWRQIIIERDTIIKK